MPSVELITEPKSESKRSMKGKCRPKSVSFSDLICIFAMPLMIISCFVFGTAIRLVKNLTKQNPRQLNVVQEPIKVVKLMCCGIMDN